MEWRYEDEILYYNEKPLLSSVDFTFLIEISTEEKAKLLEIIKSLNFLELKRSYLTKYLKENNIQMEENILLDFFEEFSFEREDNTLSATWNGLEIFTRSDEEEFIHYAEDSGEIRKKLEKLGFFQDIYIDTFYYPETETFADEFLYEELPEDIPEEEVVSIRGELTASLKYKVSFIDDPLGMPAEVLSKRKSVTQFKERVLSGFAKALIIGSTLLQINGTLAMSSDFTEDIPLSEIQSAHYEMDTALSQPVSLSQAIADKLNELITGESINDIGDFKKLAIKGGKQASDSLLKNQKRALENLDDSIQEKFDRVIQSDDEVQENIEVALDVAPSVASQNSGGIVDNEEAKESFFKFKHKIKTKIAKGEGAASIENSLLKFQAEIDGLAKNKVKEKVILKAIDLSKLAPDLSITGSASLVNHQDIDGSIALQKGNFSLEHNYKSNMTGSFQEKTISVNWHISF
jgi:hypothetical protein